MVQHCTRSVDVVLGDTFVCSFGDISGIASDSLGLCKLLLGNCSLKKTVYLVLKPIIISIFSTTYTFIKKHFPKSRTIVANTTYFQKSEQKILSLYERPEVQSAITYEHGPLHLSSRNFNLFVQYSASVWSQ